MYVLFDTARFSVAGKNEFIENNFFKCRIMVSLTNQTFCPVKLTAEILV